MGHYNGILSAMQPGIWYKAAEFTELLGVKESRIKDLLAALIEQGKIESCGKTKGKRYKKL